MRASWLRGFSAAVLVSVVACGGAAPPAAAPPAAAPPAQAPAAAGAQPAKPAASAAQPSPAAAGGQPATSGQPAAAASLDPELQKVYQEAVKVIPNLSPDVLAGAKREGALMIYRLTFEVESMYPEFNKLFPFIKVTDYKASGAPLGQKYTSEARAGRFVADVVQTSEPALAESLDGEGLVTRYEPTSSGAFPEQYVKKGVYYPFSVLLMCSAYNSDLVSENDAAVLQSWDGMVDPKWKGKAGTVLLGNGGTTLLAYSYVAREKNQEFWDKFFAQQPLVFAGAALGAERLAAGGISVHFFANEGNFFDVQKKGAPLRWKCPEPALAANMVQFIGKDAPHSNAAKLWVEWFLSKQGQSLWMKNSGQLTARTDMTDERAITKESWYKTPKEFWKFDWNDLAKGFPAIKERWDRSAADLKKAS